MCAIRFLDPENPYLHFITLAQLEVSKRDRKKVGIFEFIGPENHGVGQGFMFLTLLSSRVMGDQKSAN